MGSYVEINDTLQLTTDQGFPADLLDLKKHREAPIRLEDLADRIFEFRNKPSARIFQLDPVRVYYVHNIEGKWLFWGHAMIQTLTIEKQLDASGSWDGKSWITSGTYRISDLYDPEYQESFTRREAPADRNYFVPAPTGCSS